MPRQIMTQARRNYLRKAVRGKDGMQTLHQYMEQAYMDADGYAVVDVCLYDGLELYNPMSMGKQ